MLYILGNSIVHPCSSVQAHTVSHLDMFVMAILTAYMGMMNNHVMSILVLGC